jgi:Flp pilus assembly protein TadG
MPSLMTKMRFSRALRRFAGAREGNVAAIFAIALVPILGFIGAAIDYSRANMARSAMQAALDSAALMVSKDLSSGLIDKTQVDATAKKYFTALYTNKEATGVTVTGTYTASNGTTGSIIYLTGAGSITSDFLQFAGFPTIDFNTNSTTNWGFARLRVAMALDNTGSMAQDNKMTALKNATAGTGGLIDQLSKLSQTDGDVYISIIPFAKTVNVDTSNSGQSWIDWTDWLNPPTSQPNNGSMQATLPVNWHAIGPGAVCPFTTSNGGFTCTSGPVNGRSNCMSGGGTSCTTTGSKNVVVPGGTYSGYICPSADANSHTAYNGCWTSEPTGNSEVFCKGSSSCACPKDASGSLLDSNCTCTGSGGNKSCTGKTYVHNWTQPNVTVPVGFTNRQWSSTNSTPTVANAYNGTSTNPTTTWTGCVIDRTQPNDASVDTPSGDVATKYPANQYYENNTPYCSSSSNPQLTPVIPLSSSWSTLKTAVNNMQPTGGTNQAIGLSVALQTLVPTGAPFTVPAEDANYNYNRVVILLSDGLNTEDRWPEYGNGSQQFNGSIDARQALLCQNIKAKLDPKTNKPMYTIYTIQVNTHTPADPTSTVLQNCASGPDKFFQLTSSTQIVTAFKTIGTQLSQLRVAK